MSFTRTIEDFTCAACGRDVSGDGYTNHCPGCLWSRHVDEDPGDRGAGCGGMMRPVGVESRRGRQVVVHRCEACGVVRRVRVAPADVAAALVEVARRAAEGR
jgi:hypothetical protein